MRRAALATAILALAAPFAVRAAAVTLPDAQAKAVVEVICMDRQGSGSVTHLGTDGTYVVTAGHVVIDPDTRVQADECRVGIVRDATSVPRTYYRASIVRAVFDLKTDRDFAVLKLGDLLGGDDPLPTAPLKTDEFAKAGDALTAYGFPTGASRTMQQSAGKILSYARGTLTSDAPIQEGYSGGPATDAAGNVVGVATRVAYSLDANGVQKSVTYEMGDVVSLISWLDSFGAGEHDKYLTHADPTKFDGAPYVARDEGPGCTYVLRTAASPTVYCLLEGSYRLVFPNEATFYSWFPDERNVEYANVEDLAQYRLIGNVTMKAGTLVKIVTDPKVYVVTDSFGTLRWVPSEETARAAFGDDWAKKVRDVPDAFFGDYAVGAPLR